MYRERPGSTIPQGCSVAEVSRLGTVLVISGDNLAIALTAVSPFSASTLGQRPVLRAPRRIRT